MKHHSHADTAREIIRDANLIRHLRAGTIYDYERLDARLRALKLPAAEYEQQAKTLADVLGVTPQEEVKQ